MKYYITAAAAILLAACSTDAPTAQVMDSTSEATVKLSGKTDNVILAGGCFWCVESDFEKLAGVIKGVSGYTGGDMQNPTYRNHGQHVEAVKITFDPETVQLEELIDHYWKTIDPTDDGGQFCDRGNAYIPVIYARPDQMEVAENSKAEVQRTKPFAEPITVPIRAAKTFWDAEDYHQDYYKKNPLRYKIYRSGCGRDARLRELWGEKAKN